MYLKSLELAGFKSFAKKSTLVFTSAITHIIDERVPKMTAQPPFSPITNDEWPMTNDCFSAC